MSLDVFGIVAGAISIFAFFFAVWEHLRHRAERAIDAAHFESQQRINASATRIAVVGAQNVDLIVQRAKAEDSSKAELMNLARATRGVLLYLASELEGQADVMASFDFGRSVVNSSKSRSRKKLKLASAAGLQTNIAGVDQQIGDDPDKTLEEKE